APDAPRDGARSCPAHASSPTARARALRWTACSSRVRRLEVHIHVFETRVDVERLGPGLARSVARLLDAAERHVRLATERPGVHDGDARRNLPREQQRTMHVLRVDARGQAV